MPSFFANLPCRPGLEAQDDTCNGEWDYHCLLSISQFPHTDRFDGPVRVTLFLPELLGLEDKKRQTNSVIDLLLRERFIAHRGDIEDLCLRVDAIGNGIGVAIEPALPYDGEHVLEEFEAA